MSNPTLKEFTKHRYVGYKIALKELSDKKAESTTEGQARILTLHMEKTEAELSLLIEIAKIMGWDLSKHDPPDVGGD